MSSKVSASYNWETQLTVKLVYFLYSSLFIESIWNDIESICLIRVLLKKNDALVIILTS